jgi:hypothetical protein
MALISARSSGTIDTTTNYSYTGSDQTFTVPANITIIKVYLWGGGAGAGYNNYAPHCTGGGGGFTYGEIKVVPAETICVMVGSRGESAATSPTYGGGGQTTGSHNSSSGAGRSAIFRGSSSALANELATAGGGGGGGEGGNDGAAGAGGGEVGQDGTIDVYYLADGGSRSEGAGGGSQGAHGRRTGNAGGSYADRAHGGNSTVPASGGGGGGYYGGADGQQDCGGGGGSGYTGGMIWGITEGGHFYVPGGASHPLHPGSSIGWGYQTGGSSNGFHGYVIVQY